MASSPLRASASAPARGSGGARRGRRPNGSGQPRRPRAFSRSEDWLRTARLTRLLSWLSLIWLGIEGAVAIVAGLMAGSIALIAFGLDSAIEGVASVVIIWRFSGSRLFSEQAERRAQVLVAAQFLILAPFITYEGVEKRVLRARLGSNRAPRGVVDPTSAGAPSPRHTGFRPG